MANRRVGSALLLAALLTGCGDPQDSQDMRDAKARDFQREMADLQAGHYQMVQAPANEGGVYVLDTHLGKVSHCYTKPFEFQTWCNVAADAANGQVTPP
jgi:hypothetical protein